MSSAPTEIAVGFLGLGAIGTPMATRLARRGPLTVWNRTRARAQMFVAAHERVRLAETPREVAEGSEVVITCLPNSAEVEAVLDGPDGVLAGLRPGTLVLDCTSGIPSASRRLAELVEAREGTFADAPVSGGTNGAEAGTLTVMVGGTAATVERARPVLEAFGQRIVHLGPVGAGHAMKAVNNALLGVHILALGEGLTTLARAGVAPRTAVEVLNASSGRSFVSEALVPERVLTGAWPATFRLALLAKDAGIACDLQDDVGLDGPLLSLSEDLLRQALAELGGDPDYLEAIRLYERHAEVELRG